MEEKFGGDLHLLVHAPRKFRAAKSISHTNSINAQTQLPQRPYLHDTKTHAHHVAKILIPFVTKYREIDLPCQPPAYTSTFGTSDLRCGVSECNTHSDIQHIPIRMSFFKRGVTIDPFCVRSSVKGFLIRKMTGNCGISPCFIPAIGTSRYVEKENGRDARCAD
jgi:hypothetical protein